MGRTRTRNLRRRSGRSWLFRNFKRATIMLLAIALAIWVYSANFYAYCIGDHLTIGAAKGMIDILLATGDERNYAYFTFESVGLEDPSNFYRPQLSKSSYERPRGIKFGSFVGLMPYEEQFGLRMPYWRSKVDPPSTLATGGRIAGPATFRNWQIPCWLVALGLLLICTINFLLDRPIPENICVNCRYDLTGTASGVCPECGTARPASGKSKCAA